MRKLFVTLLAALALVAAMLTPGLVGTAQAASSAPAGALTAAAERAATPQTQRKAKAKAKRGHKHRHHHKNRVHTHWHKHHHQAHHHKHKHQAKNKSRKNRSKRLQPIAQVQTWNKLAHCESTSRWFINTGNGYYGGLQISPSTWRGFGGARFAALPHQASKAEQITVGKRIKNGQGWGAWPSCSRKVGLR